MNQHVDNLEKCVLKKHDSDMFFLYLTLIQMQKCGANNCLYNS